MIAALRLFNPQQTGFDSRTLRAVYAEMLPEFPNSMSPRTKSDQRTCLKHWEQATGDPSVSQITRETIRQLRDYLIGQGVSGETINKVWRTLRAMLRFAHDELHWIDQIPAVSPFMRSRLVDVSPSMPREVLSHDELARMWANCLLARYPVVQPCLAWRTFLVLAWVTGMRTGDLVQLPWSAVLWNQKLIRFAADKTGKLQGLPLLPWVETHLQRWRNACPTGERIFSGFAKRGHVDHQRSKAFAGYYVTWNRVITDGIDPRPQIKTLRADMVTELNDVQDGVGGWAAGHSPVGVTETNYDKPSRRVRKAFELRPVPPCFLWGLDNADAEVVHAGAGRADPPAALAGAE